MSWPLVGGSLPADIDTDDRTMDHGVVSKRIRAAAALVIGPEAAIPGDDRHMLPRLKIDQAKALPGEVGRCAKAAYIPVQPKGPSIGKCIAVTKPYNGVDPVLIAAQLDAQIIEGDARIQFSVANSGNPVEAVRTIQEPIGAGEIEDLRVEFRLNVACTGNLFFTQVKIVVVDEKTKFTPVRRNKSHGEHPFQVVPDSIEIDARTCGSAPDPQVAVDIDGPQVERGKIELPVAILGTDSFDVNEVDVNSISIADTVFPVNIPSIEDVGMPLFEGEGCECNETGADGFADLVIHFSRREITLALGLDALGPGTIVPITVEGILLDGTRFIATDCVTLVPRND